MDDTPLDAIIGGEPNAIAPSQEPAKPDQQQQQPDTTTQGGADKPTTDAGTPPADKPKKEQTEADKAFATLRRELRNEKRAREELERRLQQPQTQQPIDPVVDPEGFSKSFDVRLSNAVNATRVAVFEQVASEKYPDFEEMRELFVENARENPSLREEMFQARNPAEFAYKWAKEHTARQEIGDPVQYAEKIRKETLEKTMGEIDKLVEAKVKERLAGLLPSSLAETQTQGGRVNNPEGFNGPTPLSEILKKR